MRREKARFIVMQDDAEKDAEVELSLCLSIGGGSSRMTPKPSSVSCELQEEENGESAREFSVSGRGILDFELLSGADGSSCADLDDSAAPFCPNFLNPTLRPYPEMEMRGIQFVNEFGFPCLMMPWWAPAVPMASGNIRPLRSPASPGSGNAVDVGRGSFSDISDQASSSLQGAEPKDEFPGSGKSSSGGDESGNSKRRRRWMSTCTMKRPPPAGTADGRSLSGGAPAALPRLPCVSTTGKGPKGKTITGLLYRYTAAEVSIVCVCHGSFFSPAEFVKHAGGTDVDAANPLRHITVVPF